MSLIAIISASMSIAVYHHYNTKSIELAIRSIKNQISNNQNFERKTSLENSLKTGQYVPDLVFASKISTPAVVYIEGQGIEDSKSFFAEKAFSTGSGVIISPDGYIVTNNHVIEKATNLKVLLNDNREYSARIIGNDANTDLALIKIEDSGLPYLEFGDSDSSNVGEWVLAVGNPFKLQSTVTAGIISAKARNINILNTQQYRIESFIQTDAAVNPGNSGGALVNTSGELIGINTAIMTYTGRYEGYSFSVPANLVKKVITDLKDFGTVQRGLLGVTIENVDDQKSKYYGLTRVAGVFISNTSKDGAADIAGLKAEDIILSINSNIVNNVSELQEIIGTMRPGMEIAVGFWRDKKELKTKAILKNQINSTELIATRKDPVLMKYGFEVRDLSEAENQMLKVKGVKVINIHRNSVIAKTNMAPDYIITTVNNKPIGNVNELIDAIEKAESKVLFNGIYEQYTGYYPYSFFK
ncbi:MAG: trypsin-like peptidase domain-containing protein [Saprospiraceae bacterium]|nr:trypsin-like peptidase domain-containing protein [Saprospiraceae bacterium]